ncbi:MAG: hypothetical protein V2A76_04040 [Planctomycetota bacterium]
MKLTIAIATAVLLGLGLEAQAQKSATGGAIGATSGVTVVNPVMVTPGVDYLAAASVPVAGVNSWDSPGSAFNVWLYDTTGGTGANFSAVSWNVSIATVGYSWLNEARIYFDGSDQDGSGLWLTPGFAFSSPGRGHFTSGGVIDLTDNGIPDVPVLTDGQIWMEFNEAYDDVTGGIDANWLSGFVNLYYDANCGLVSSFGTACPGNGGFIPMFEIGCAQVGQPLTVDLWDCEGGALWFMCFSTGTGTQPLPGGGCTLDLAPGWFFLPLGAIPGAGPGGGAIHFTIAPLATAGHVFVQNVLKDSVTGFITTNGLDITVNP